MSLQSLLNEHALQPRNRGVMQGADASAHGANPMCADSLDIFVRFSSAPELRIEKVMYEGRGCAVCLAAASVMSEQVKGKSISEVLAYRLVDVSAWLEAPIGRMREGCALLGLQTLQKAVKAYAQT